MIDGPGKYTTRDGEAAVVTHATATGWHGNVAGSIRSTAWHPDGRKFSYDQDSEKNHPHDIVAKQED